MGFSFGETKLPLNKGELTSAESDCSGDKIVNNINPIPTINKIVDSKIRNNLPKDKVNFS
jgi:NOL1/NOP2/fmu family ribosome biogenesis protein